MVTNHCYPKPAEHVGSGTAAHASHPLPADRLRTWLNNLLLCTQSGSSYSEHTQNHGHATVNQKVNVDRKKGKEAKKSFLNLNCCRQNTDYRSIPSPSYSFFIPLGPCSKETQAVFIPQAVVLESLQDSLGGFDFPESHPEPLSPSEHLKLIPQTHSHPGPQPIATSVFRCSKLTANDRSNRTRLLLGYFLIISFNIVVSFTCYCRHLKVLPFVNIFSLADGKCTFEVLLLGNVFRR